MMMQRLVLSAVLLTLTCDVTSLQNEAESSSENIHRRHTRALDDDISNEKSEFLDLKFRNLTSIPNAMFRNAPRQIKFLFLENNFISRVDVDAFEGLPNLEYLYISQNLLTSLPDGVFRFTPRLKGVALSNNSITELSSRLFTGLFDLNYVEVCDNKVELTLHNDTFANLPSLQYLHMWSSGIKQIPHGILKNSYNLEHINIRNNKLEEIHESVLSHLKKLKALLIGSNRIKSISPAMFNKDGILELIQADNNGLIISKSQDVYPPTDAYLSSQKDKEFPTSGQFYSPFQNLKHLKYLYLHYNKISVICADWRSSHTLMDLNLTSNSISSLSNEDLHFRPQLTVYLMDNKIKYFDPYEYDSNRPAPKIILNNNPYRCSCSFRSFIQKYSRGKLTKLDINEARCAEPTDLKGKKLSELTETSLGNCSSKDEFEPDLQITPSESIFGYKSDVWTSLTCSGINLPKTSSVCLMQFKDGEESYWNCFSSLPSIRFFFSPTESDDNSNMYCIAEHYVNKDYSRAIRLTQSEQVTLRLVNT